jgi:hypothetical protein
MADDELFSLIAKIAEAENESERHEIAERTDRWEAAEMSLI